MHRMKWIPKSTAEQKDKQDKPQLPEASHRPKPQSKLSHPRQSRGRKKPAASLEDLLYKAIIADQPDEIKSLIRRGADPNTRRGIIVSTTPLHFAVMRGKKQAVLALLEMKAQVNLNTTASGSTTFDLPPGTPLHSAAMTRATEIMKTLLNAGAQVNLPDAMGDTPLHVAVYGSSEGSHQKAVEVLLEAGADTTIKNKRGLTPAALASGEGETDIAALLVKWDISKQRETAGQLEPKMYHS